MLSPLIYQNNDMTLIALDQSVGTRPYFVTEPQITVVVNMAKGKNGRRKLWTTEVYGVIYFHLLRRYINRRIIVPSFDWQQ